MIKNMLFLVIFFKFMKKYETILDFFKQAIEGSIKIN